MSHNFTWKAQPIFISSTFTDMMTERDVLRDFVFKELEEKLYDRRIRLEPIDLRWGVETTTEKEKEQKELMVLKVCLNEIDRCKPFFIGIIGDRYGWIPPEKRMEDAEKEKGFKSTLKDKSVTALEIEYGVLTSKEQLKRNLFFFREPLPYNEMPENIRAEYADMHNPELKEIDTKKRLEDFKKLITETVGKDRVFTYKAEWDGNCVTGLEDFKKKATEQLWKELDEQTKELEGTRPKTWEEEEQKYLLDFIEERTISFSGREDVINDLKKFALSESGYDNWGKCLTGESGFGKSALFAKLYKELQNEDVVLLAHAADISLRSNSLENMLTIWIEELAAHLKINVTEELKEKNKFEDLTKLFAQLLSRASVNKRVVVLVDALNQFERTEHSKYVNWLPELIPANAKFIFTAIAGEETGHLAKRKGIKLEELKPVSRADAQKIINIICQRYHKTLNPEAVEILLEKKKADGTFAYSNPLWLTMAVDEFLLMDEDDFARMKGLEGDAEQKLKQLLIISAKEMPAAIAGMYAYVFNRCKIFGEKFVNALLSYIGIARGGLRESDLEQLITNYTNAKWENLNFASFRRYLRNHLVRKGELGLWDFRHLQVRESLKQGLLADEKEVTTLHKNLAGHLEQIGNEDPLHLTEILWHLFKCNDKKKVAEIYGSNWCYNYRTGNYSITLRDILLEKDVNTEWISSLVEAVEISDSVKRAIINNVHFNLDDRIKNHITLNSRLKLIQKILKASCQLAKRNPNSAEYARDLSISYNSSGDILTALGNTKNALTSYESSLKIREGLYNRNPDSAEYARDLAISYDNIGDIYTAIGNTKSALISYNNSLKIREGSHIRNPNSDLYTSDLAISYAKLGDVYASLGDTKSALSSYENSNNLFSELHKQNPDSTEYISDLGGVYERVGNIFAALGDTKSALSSYENSHNLFLKLRKRNPDSAEYARDVSVSSDRIGDIYKVLGNAKSALSNYESSLKIREELRKLNPDLTLYASDLAVSYTNVGDVYIALSDTKNALSSYESSLKIREELCRQNPDSAENASRLSVSYDRIGDISSALGDTKRALSSYESSLKIREELCKRNPDSALYACNLAISYERLGDIYTALGDTKSTLSCYESSHNLFLELRKRNSESAEYMWGLSVSYNKIGDVYTALGDTKSALSSYESSHNLFLELRKRNPDSTEYARGLGTTYQKIGDIYTYTSLGDTKRGLSSFESSLEIAEELHKRNPDSSEYARDIYCSIIRIGDISKALGDMKKGLSSYKSSLEIAVELRKRNPDSAEYARDLGFSYERIGDIYTALGDTKSALSNYESSTKIREELCERNPYSAEYARDIIVSYYKLAGYYHQINDPKVEEIFTKLIEALTYMKNKKMFMDPPLVNLCKQLGIE